MELGIGHLLFEFGEGADADIEALMPLEGSGKDHDIAVILPGARAPRKDLRIGQIDDH